MACPAIKRPELAATCAAPGELVEGGGFHCKGWRARFAALGRSPSFWRLRSADFGGVARQERLGLVCQPCKSKPPGQVQLRCGFLCDSARTPRARAPASKADRATASIHFLRSGAASERLSRLTLAVVIGLLQSLAGATPRNAGQACLRRLCGRLRSLEGLPLRPSPSRSYFTRVELATEDWLDLDWWLDALTRGLR